MSDTLRVQTIRRVIADYFQNSTTGLIEADEALFVIDEILNDPHIEKNSEAYYEPDIVDSGKPPFDPDPKAFDVVV